jgi:hypothetical protein
LDEFPPLSRPGATGQAATPGSGRMLDSPELEAWAVKDLVPQDAEGLGDFMAGLHIVSELLLHQLQDGTGHPPAVTLQKLAILAETWRATPSAG